MKNGERGFAEAVPDICRERPGFDRAAFQAEFDREVVASFTRALG